MTEWYSIPITVEKEITPEKALGIAIRMRSVARRIFLLAADLHGVKSELDQNWKGNARNRFFDDFEDQPRYLDEMSEILENHATNIENITVVITVIDHVQIPIYW